MPFVKSKSIRATVQRSLAYILNPEKTDDLFLTSSLNCLLSFYHAPIFNHIITYKNLFAKL